MNTIVSRVKYIYKYIKSQVANFSWPFTPLIKTMHIYINLHFVVIVGFIIIYMDVSIKQQIAPAHMVRDSRVVKFDLGSDVTNGVRLRVTEIQAFYSRDGDLTRAELRDITHSWPSASLYVLRLFASVSFNRAQRNQRPRLQAKHSRSFFL